MTEQEAIEECFRRLIARVEKDGERIAVLEKEVAELRKIAAERVETIGT